MMYLPLLCLRRSDHLYLFFVQWSPEAFGDGMGSVSREPGFMVVKKIDESESGEEQTTSDFSPKEWEVDPVQLSSPALLSAHRLDVIFDVTVLCHPS